LDADQNSSIYLLKKHVGVGLPIHETKKFSVFQKSRDGLGIKIDPGETENLA